MSVTLTPAAIDHVSGQLSQRGKGLGIRLGVKTTGCSGLSYVLEFVDEPANDDVCFDESGVSVYIDKKSLVYLDGLHLDFKKEGLNEGLTFTNPNSSGECGCGESFHV